MGGARGTRLLYSLPPRRHHPTAVPTFTETPAPPRDMMFDYTDLYKHPGVPGFAALREAVDAAFDPARHGSLAQWRALLERLSWSSHVVDLSADRVHIGDAGEIDEPRRAELERLLRGLHPWRKGPFCMFGVHIDTEWRSDWKWRRLIPHIQPLAGRRVLDVGCGNGYYAWRMLGAGAEQVVGLDPTLLYVMQYWAARRLMARPGPAWVLPLALEQLPPHLEAFDTVFSMGVIYHRRDPLEHLRALWGALRPGGELVLETLVLEGDEARLLVPPDRYARMRNVWAVAACPVVEQWLRAAGFVDVRCVDVTRTTVAEQRSTDWMRFQSLADFLDPADGRRTVEGLPGPVRGVFVGVKAGSGFKVNAGTAASDSP